MPRETKRITKKKEMKRLILIFTIISQFTFAQDNYNFSTQNNQIEWQKVYEIDLTKNEIEKIVKTNGIFKNIFSEDNSITGDIENVTADYKGAGSSGMLTSFYVQNTTIAGRFQVEFKEGRYKIILNGINLKTSNDLSSSGLSVMSANSTQPLSYYAIKSLQFRKSFLKSDAKIYDYTFSNLFDFSRYQTKSEDW